MPPSAPLMPQQPQQTVASDDAVSLFTAPTEEHATDTDSWNHSKFFTNTSDDANRILATATTKNQITQLLPATTSSTQTGNVAAGSNYELAQTTNATTLQQLQVQQHPVETGMNSIWNNGMMGMNPYNTPTSMYGNYGGGFGNMNSMMNSLPMMMPTTVTGGPFSTITNYLLGIQNLIMSIGQVVQIVSFNASSLQQLCESILAMMEHAIKSWHEQQQQQRNKKLTSCTNRIDDDTDATPEEMQRMIQQQRRMRALRYTISIAISYIGYSLVRKLWSRYQQQQQLQYPAAVWDHYNNNDSNNNNHHHRHIMPTTTPTTYPNNHYYPTQPPSVPYNPNNPHWNSPPYLPPPPPQQSYHHYNNSDPYYNNCNTPYSVQQPQSNAMSL